MPSRAHRFCGKFCERIHREHSRFMYDPKTCGVVMHGEEEALVKCCNCGKPMPEAA